VAAECQRHFIAISAGQQQPQPGPTPLLDPRCFEIRRKGRHGLSALYSSCMRTLANGGAGRITNAQL
jgi:hypothetical protein